MSYIGNVSDVEQDKNISDFHHNRKSSSSNLIAKTMASQKLSENRWNDKHDDSDSEISDSEHFLAKGAFLLTPSYELSMERAALICEKMNFKGCFSLTKTATGILFKFSHPEDYQSVFKKGFHKVTGARFYKKIAIPCRPQKTFTLYVIDVPEEIPVEDIRHSLYRFNSIVEVVRLVVQNSVISEKNFEGNITPKQQISVKDEQKNQEIPPPIIRVTLASLEEYNILLQNGLNFYDATFFPTEANIPAITSAKIAYKKRLIDGSIPGRVRELLPVFDAAGFIKLPPPTSKTFKPRP